MSRREKKTIAADQPVSTEETIGSRLRELRRGLDATLAEISEKTGVSVSALSKIENDQISASYDILKRICDGLSIGIEDLVSPGAKAVVSRPQDQHRAAAGEGGRAVHEWTVRLSGACQRNLP